ncbi:unnamed protein product [Amoebophrya sp. A25]|nr:unnamed protein product [Amoebophrya sp. A25]|eukprot:GSA25T00027996001.1
MTRQASASGPLSDVIAVVCSFSLLAFCSSQFVADLFPSIALVRSACSLRFLLLSEIWTRWRPRPRLMGLPTPTLPPLWRLRPWARSFG